MCLDCAGAYGLHMSPSLGALRVTKKLKKKSNLFQNPSFLQKKQKSSKKELQKVSKRVREFPGWRPLGHLWSSKLIFASKSEPTAPPKCPQGPKHASKMIPKGPKMILKVTLKVYSLGTLTLDRRFEQRPGGLREALTIRPPIERSGWARGVADHSTSAVSIC